MGKGSAPATDPLDLTPFFARVSDDPLAEAFDDGRQAHPPSGQIPIDKSDYAATWQQVLNTPRTRPGMAYVHIPFCENHCLFCGFYQNAWRPEQGAGYVDNVLKQAAQFTGKPVLQGPPLRALYFGGGTPTALAARDIGRLVSGLRDILPLAPDCEITLEGRVYSFTPDKMDAAFAAGVNRVSLGVQTFDTKIRRGLGRKVPREGVLETLRELVARDAGPIVIDLIYGLPKQTLQTWAEDLAMVDALGLDGVDHYGLNLIPGTPLLLSMEKDKLQPITKRELGRFYAAGHDAMQAVGWRPISTSHWQQPDLRERSVYNFGAKTGWDFFGLGAGAGGSLGGIGTYNTPMLEVYGAQLAKGEAPIMGMTRASPIAPILNAMRAGMERGRLDPDALARAKALAAPDGPDPVAALTPLWAQWQEAGLMRPHYRFQELTLAGRFWQVQQTQRMTRALMQLYLPKDQSGMDSWSAGPSKPRHMTMRRKQNVG